MTEQSEDTTRTRQALRREMLARRAGLSPVWHAEASAAIVGHLLNTLPAPKIAAFCWPVKHEPDVRAAITAWAATGTRAALPVVTAPATALSFRLWTPECAMVVDRYGIPAPASGEFILPDLILLPLNGFDAQGYRLGYGGGFFDRTLATLRPRPLAVGVGFEINRLHTINPGRHDEPLDWLVTERGAFKPNSAVDR